MGKWQTRVIPVVRSQLETYSYRPTVRGMFYNLVSSNVIPNTQKAYKGLVDALGVAIRNGDLPINAFSDTTRRINDIDDDHQNPQDYILGYVNTLKTAPEHYFNNIPRWHKQPHYVEIVSEKNALRGLFTEIVESENLQVRVVPNGGWSSRVYKHDMLTRLRRKSSISDVDDNGNPIRKKFHVLYFGDYDPTGRRIDMNMSLDLALSKAGYQDNRLEKKSKQLRSGNESFEGEIYEWIEGAKENLLFERVALTHEQIQEFGLQELKNPDPEVLKKLKKDPNAQAFINENGSLFQIELDAMQKEGMKDRFKQLVVDSVNKYFDNRIYEEMMKEYTHTDLQRILDTHVEFLEPLTRWAATTESTNQGQEDLGRGLEEKMADQLSSYLLEHLSYISNMSELQTEFVKVQRHRINESYYVTIPYQIAKSIGVHKGQIVRVQSDANKVVMEKV